MFIFLTLILYPNKTQNHWEDALSEFNMHYNQKQ